MIKDPIRNIEVSSGTVHANADGELYVQIIDDYGYQREWTFKAVPRDEAHEWESHVYRHPGIRSVCRMPAKKARKVIDLFMTIIEEYPTIFFNSQGPRAKAFVRMHEDMLQGEWPSQKLIELY